MTVEVADSDFQKEVLESNGVVVVDFWAEWCGPCKVQGPIIDKLAKDHKDDENVKFAKLDVDANPATSAQYQILSIPTLLFFKGGEKVEVMIGLQSEDRIMQKIAEMTA
ncbi:thioredoxin [Candidatus Dojkabacteria bacterium]|nr:thioredoxin [Candidatus Dojkabacteria bacterium]